MADGEDSVDHVEDDSPGGEQRWLFFTVVDWAPSRSKKLSSMRSTSTALLVTDIAVAVYDIHGDEPEILGDGPIKLRKRTGMPMLLRWGKLLGDAKILQEHVLQWSRKPGHEAEVDVPNADPHVIKMLLRSKAYPGPGGLLHIVHGGPGADNCIEKLQDCCIAVHTPQGVVRLAGVS